MGGGICRGRIMEDGGQKRWGAGCGGGGAVKEIRKEEDTKQLRWSLSHSLSLTSLSHQSSHLSSLLSFLSPCPRVCLSQSFVLFVERERKEGDFILLVLLFSGVAELAWSKGGRAQVVPSCSFRFSFSSFCLSFFIYYIILYYLYMILFMYTQLVAFGRPAPHSCLSLSASPPAVCKHGWMIFLWFICFFLSWRSWRCGYLGCCHGIRYTCFSGREHFVGRPRPSPKKHH